MESLWETHGRRLSEAGLRRGSDTSVVLTEDTDSFIIGDRVWVGGTKPGSIAYIGETQFAPGDWAGIVLDEPIGKNDGSVAGSRYFQCEPKRGIFSRLTRLTRQPLSEAMARSSSIDEKTPTSPLDGSRGTLNKSMSPSLNASTTSLSSVSHKDLKIGDRVIVSSSQGSKTGVLRYVGTTEFATGEWCGIELDDPVGKNDGSVGDTRYFECRHPHGLFAALHKVSRSPSSRRTSAMCVVHKPTGASMNSSIRRMGGSRESLASISSVASTSPGISARGRTSGSRETLKEKQQEIEMLRKERDFERGRVSKAAIQADNAEQTVMALKQEYNKYREDMEKTVQEAQMALAQLLDEKNMLKVHLEEERQKYEDLLFRFEEESVNKDDIQRQNTDQCVINTLNEGKIWEIEKQLSEERERVIQLEHENVKLFEAEEELVKLRTELSIALSEKKDFQDIQNRNLCLQEAKITLEKQMLERNDLIEQHVALINDLKSQLTERDAESATRKKLENDLRQSSAEMKQNLVESSNALIETMKKEQQINSETLKKEIEQLKEIIENITKEKRMLMQEHKNTISEMENMMESQIQQLETESKHFSAAQKAELHKIMAENVEQINNMSENFEKQLTQRDSQIHSMAVQLDEKSAEIDKLGVELFSQHRAIVDKDQEMKILLERVEDLSGKLKLRETENIEFKNKIDGIRSESDYSSFIQENKKLKESMESLLALSANSSAQLKKLNEDLQTKENELSELQNVTTAEIQELKKSFQSQIEMKTNYIAEISADISEKSMRLSALEKEVDDLKFIIANKDEEMKHLLEKISEFQDAITLSDQTKTNLESELRMYDVNIAALNEKLMKAEEKSKHLTEQKIKLEAEIENIIRTSDNSSDQLLKYSEDLRAKETELDNMRDRSNQFENSLTLAEAKLANTVEELEMTSQSVEHFRAEASDMKTKTIAEIKAKNELIQEFDKLMAREREVLETIKSKDRIEEELKIKLTETFGLTVKLQKNEEALVDASNKYLSAQKKHEEKEQMLQTQMQEMGKELSNYKNELKMSVEFNNKSAADRAVIEASLTELTNTLKSEIEEKNKIEALMLNKSVEILRLESQIAEVRKERDEVKESVQLWEGRYNETLKELALLKSTNAKTKSQTVLDLTNVKQQLMHAEAINKELVDRLKNSDDSVNDMKKMLDKTVNLFEKSESEKSELSVALENGEASIKEIEERLEIGQKEFNQALNEQSEENTKLKEDIRSRNAIIIDMQNNLEQKNSALEKTLAEIETLKKMAKEFELRNNQEISAMEAESKSIVKLMNDFKEKNSVLQYEVFALNNQLISNEMLTEELKKEIESIREIEKITTKNEQSNCSIELEAKQIQIDDLDKENNNLRIAKNTIEELLKAEQDKVRSLLDSLQEIKLSSARQMESFKEDLKRATAEEAVSKENENRLEKDNRLITEKLNQALGDLKTLSENKKNSQERIQSNEKIQSTDGDKKQSSGPENELQKLADENETYKGQIDFLNSVIVDMQRKNETLLCKIEVLEMGIPANEADDYSRITLGKRIETPRMFCDICDQFDLHETEDCPRQAQDFTGPEVPKKSPKKPSIDRPYCDNCEVFGHDTLNCDDAETF